MQSPRPKLLKASACALVFALAACTPSDPARPPGGAPSAQPQKTGAAPPDPSQAMAFAAGRELIGTPAPRLSFKTVDGDVVRLGETGRPIYLKFWATWCVTCREQMPSFIADHDRIGTAMDVVAVNTGVNDDLAAVEAYRREVGLRMPVAIDDGRLGEAFRLKVTPQHVIIGRDGRVRYVGHLDDDRLRTELQAAIDDRPISAPAGGDAANTKAARARGATLATVQGGQVEIGGPAAGPPRLLYFFSPWCETYLAESRPAVAEACRTTREAVTRAAQADRARVIAVASGLSSDTDSVERFLKRTGFDAPVVLDADGALFRRFGVRSFPAVIQLDAAGRPVGRMGADDVDALGRAAARGA